MAAWSYEISLRVWKNISLASIYYIDTNKVQNHFTLFFFFLAAKGAINYLAIATGDLFTCEDNMLFSRVKVSCFRAKAHLGGLICNTDV